MIKKSLRATNGVKATTVLSDRQHKPYTHKGSDSEEKIKMCLNCTKPASQCKGDCFGKS